MSNVALSGNASGTGTFTIASPNSNTNRTLDLPDASGTILTTATAGVPINGPAFLANTPVNRSAANGTQTEMTGFSTPTFDTASCFNVTTGRFTPNVAGYYQFSWSVSFGANGIGAATLVGGSLGKNGTITWPAGITMSSSGFPTIGSSTVTFMNGTTDYVSVFAFQNTGSTVSNFSSFFAGALIRSAT
jgi:hypothetical protein